MQCWSQKTKSSTTVWPSYATPGHMLQVFWNNTAQWYVPIHGYCSIAFKNQVIESAQVSVNRQVGKENVVYKQSGGVYSTFCYTYFHLHICGWYRHAMAYEEKSRNNLWSQFFLLTMWLLGVDHRSSFLGSSTCWTISSAHCRVLFSHKQALTRIFFHQNHKM